jgi:hypothetical protein
MLETPVELSTFIPFLETGIIFTVLIPDAGYSLGGALLLTGVSFCIFCDSKAVFGFVSGSFSVNEETYPSASGCSISGYVY